VGLRPFDCLGLWVRIQQSACISVSYMCCVLSFRGLYVGLISCLEESYHVWCVWLWSRRSLIRGYDPIKGRNKLWGWWKLIYCFVTEIIYLTLGLDVNVIHFTDISLELSLKVFLSYYDTILGHVFTETLNRTVCT